MKRVHLYTLLAATIAIAALLPSRASSEEATCFGIGTLKETFHKVFPNAEQSTVEGVAAKIYLEAYNSQGRRSAYAGEALLVIEKAMPGNYSVVIPFKQGVGCRPIFTGPKLHKTIMNRIGRESA